MYTVRLTTQVVKGFAQVCGTVHTVNSRTPSSRPRPIGPRPRSRDSPSREERKEATRRAIVAAALKLLDDRSFSGLSLREVTREAGIVPAAFYRHFESMDALGLVLIDESFRALRDMLRGARAGKLDPNRVIESSVEILVASVTERREHWRFIGRERSQRRDRAALCHPHRDPADHLGAGHRPGPLPGAERHGAPRTSTSWRACSSTR